MVFYLVDACSENGEEYPLTAVPKSQYTVVRYLTVPIRNPNQTVEPKFVAVIDIDPALNGHCYRFDDVVFPGNLMFRTTPGMLEYVARYPRIYDLMMVSMTSSSIPPVFWSRSSGTIWGTGTSRGNQVRQPIRG